MCLKKKFNWSNASLVILFSGWTCFNTLLIPILKICFIHYLFIETNFIFILFNKKMPNLKNNQIKRLSFKAGVLRLSELNYDELRALIGIKLEPIIKKSYIVANNQHRKIIQLDERT